jgi:hypothetical protein
MSHPERDIQDVLDQLSALEPTAADAPRPAPQALVQLRQQIESQTNNSFSYQLRRFFTMTNRKLAAITVSLILLFIVAFSFPAVRAAASDFLGLFRVQKFAAVSVSPEQIAVLEELAQEGLMPGEFEVIREPGGHTPVDSLAAAADMTGLAVRSPVGLGQPQEVYVADGGEGRLTVDLEGARAILEATGVDPNLLPDDLDGARVHVAVSASVQQHWSNGLTLVQTESPEVDYPDNLDPTVLGKALLQVLGMNEEEAQRLSQEIDWTSTLLLPIPQDVASFNEVTVEGVSGLALNNLSGPESALMWQKDGVVYLLSGRGRTAELIDIANSLQ